MNYSKQTKTQLIERIEELERQAESAHDECYSSDCVDDVIQQHREEWENERFKELQRKDPETHRANFKIINGAA